MIIIRGSCSRATKNHYSFIGSNYWPDEKWQGSPAILITFGDKEYSRENFIRIIKRVEEEVMNES